MKYEYLVEGAPMFWLGRADGGSEITEWLNAKASEEEWELVGVSHPVCYFKREVREIETKDYDLPDRNPEFT